MAKQEKAKVTKLEKGTVYQEGINNKIKVIKRRSYGFKDMEYFFLKILGCWR